MKSIEAKTPRTSKTQDVAFTFGSIEPFADNDEYVSKGLVFDILEIAFEPGKGYEGSDRWALTVKPQDREAEIMTLGSNPRRDEQLQAARASVDRHGPISGVRLKKSRNAYYLEDAPSA